MKILCDVCGEAEASIYCAADEASLCTACDHRVHHANKLAGKHHRFSLIPPSPKQSPICDICQERKAFLFCQQDRAILCRECDIPIHKANQHTQKHTRFLLTGVRISSTPAESAKPNNPHHHKPAGAACTSPPAKGTTPHSSTAAPQEFSTSSISEYLIETLPGWHVEDLLDSSSPSPPSFCKSGENEMMLPFWDGDLMSNSRSGFSTDNMGFWVPQVEVHQNQNQNQNQSSLDYNNNNINVAFDLANGCRDVQFKEFSTNSIKSTRKRSEDNSFAVPQISPALSSAASKRSKSFW